MKGKAFIATGVALLVAFVGISQARMLSTEIERNLCHTVGGGKFKEIPGFPGEMIDRRLFNDIKKLKRKYNIFITDGYSTDPVHSANGEHPLGLALDIVPNFAKGGDWNDIDRLAEWAEPSQNAPRQPFRWVGYNGDSGHGSGHHLHLSYSHGASSFGTPVEEMYSMLCPDKRGGGDPGGGDGGGDGGGGGIGTRSAHSDGGGGTGSLGPLSELEAERADDDERSFQGIPLRDLAPVTPETAGVGL